MDLSFAAASDGEDEWVEDNPAEPAPEVTSLALVARSARPPAVPGAAAAGAAPRALPSTAPPPSKIHSNPGTRYFVIKSDSHKNLLKSIEHGVWATHRHNEERLSDALCEAPHVILIFSVSMSSCFQGYAKMLCQPGASRKTGIFQGFGRAFDVRWLRLDDLEFVDVSSITNPLNENKSVKMSRDGQELSHEVGKRLCELVDERVYQGDPFGYVVDDQEPETGGLGGPPRAPPPQRARQPQQVPARPPDAAPLPPASGPCGYAPQVPAAAYHLPPPPQMAPPPPGPGPPPPWAFSAWSGLAWAGAPGRGAAPSYSSSSSYSDSGSEPRARRARPQEKKARDRRARSRRGASGRRRGRRRRGGRSRSRRGRRRAEPPPAVEAAAAPPAPPAPPTAPRAQAVAARALDQAEQKALQKRLGDRVARIDGVSSDQATPRRGERRRSRAPALRAGSPVAGWSCRLSGPARSLRSARLARVRWRCARWKRGRAAHPRAGRPPACKSGPRARADPARRRPRRGRAEGTRDVLAEYVVCMVVERKSAAEVQAELQDFLGHHAPAFLKWLLKHLDKKYAIQLAAPPAERAGAAAAAAGPAPAQRGRAPAGAPPSTWRGARPLGVS